KSITLLSIVSLAGLILFIKRELTYKFPIVNLRVLNDSNLKVGVIMATILGFGLYASTFLIPIYTQSVLRWSAFDAGLLLIPSSLMTGFMMPLVGKMIQKGISQKYMITAGFIAFFAFTFWMSRVLTPDTGEEFMFWPLILRGVGLGLLFVPITSLSLSTLKGKDIGDGAAFTGMMRQLGGSFGIAIITTFIARFNQQHRVDMVAKLDRTKFVVQNQINMLQKGFMAKGATFNQAIDKTNQVLEIKVMKQASVLSFMDIFMYLGIVFLLCIPIVFILKTGNKKIDLSNIH
ncbi:MAG: MFS transporter, partial [Flavobacterium sp.]|nr:MFS transporter [Flavobacterium sp.]